MVAGQLYKSWGQYGIEMAVPFLWFAFIFVHFIYIVSCLLKFFKVIMIERIFLFRSIMVFLNIV